jgi:hypothetical protein
MLSDEERERGNVGLSMLGEELLGMLAEEERENKC